MKKKFLNVIKILSIILFFAWLGFLFLYGPVFIVFWDWMIDAQTQAELRSQHFQFHGFFTAVVLNIYSCALSFFISKEALLKESISNIVFVKLLLTYIPVIAFSVIYFLV